MSKLGTIFALVLVLTLVVIHAARQEPGFASDSLNVKAEKAETEESCEGVEEDECLIRRTLVAHVDYIYTQGETENP
ncbi:hypothetical protein P3X46_021132 [Hevea brasiliensis]|uniref:Phytosulfokine n=1 Tax=Hevea brasiliensis TaxID=3981 RepID=A0ABQ9LGK7_HEVBR|nr:phytosulfokines [Hevea brasiliensis]KAJ9166362.1 hypothetical protein P3X46_021132 [Hevea brasiliensis]